MSSFRCFDMVRRPMSLADQNPLQMLTEAGKIPTNINELIRSPISMSSSDRY